NKEVRSRTHPANVVSVSFSVDKTKVATAAADSLVRVWDVATQQELQSFPHAGGAVKGVVVHTNNTNVVAGGADKTVTVHAIGAAPPLPRRPPRPPPARRPPRPP